MPAQTGSLSACGLAAALLTVGAPSVASDQVFQCGSAAAPRFTDVRDAPDCRLIIGMADRTAARPALPRATVDPAARARLLPVVEAAARRHRVPERLLEALVEAESGFQVRAISPKGAMGLTQLMPETAVQLGIVDAFDAAANLDGGARHLRGLLDRYGGDLRLSLAAYNAGAGAVERYGMAVPPFAETRGYVRRVMQRHGELTHARR